MDLPGSELMRGEDWREREREVKSAKGVASKSRINQGRSSNKGGGKSVDRCVRVEKKKTLSLCKFTSLCNIVDGCARITPAFSKVN